MLRRNLLVGLPVLLALACQRAPEQRAAMEESKVGAEEPGTPEWKIANAMSAAPAQIAQAAAVMDWPAEPGGEMKTLRAGTNGWTCLPDFPTTPANDPMCLDEPFLNWAGAYMSGTEPSIERTGFGYMLQGGADASNTDPFATEPKPGESWVKSGPHVMIVVPNPATLEGVPTDPENGGPWLMWKGSPFAHVMFPVGGS